MKPRDWILSCCDYWRKSGYRMQCRFKNWLKAHLLKPGHAGETYKSESSWGNSIIIVTHSGLRDAVVPSVLSYKHRIVMRTGHLDVFGAIFRVSVWFKSSQHVCIFQPRQPFTCKSCCYLISVRIVWVLNFQTQDKQMPTSAPPLFKTPSRGGLGGCPSSLWTLLR